MSILRLCDLMDLFAPLPASAIEAPVVIEDVSGEDAIRLAVRSVVYEHGEVLITLDDEEPQ